VDEIVELVDENEDVHGPLHEIRRVTGRSCPGCGLNYRLASAD
jgi:hypothetical protein